MNAHTPGPWLIEDSNGFTIAARHTKGRVNIPVAYPAYTSEREANARLIAAAPDLLEACKDLNGYLNAVANQLPVSELSAVLEKVKRSADAIAKATNSTVSPS